MHVQHSLLPVSSMNHIAGWDALACCMHQITLLQMIAIRVEFCCCGVGSERINMLLWLFSTFNIQIWYRGKYVVAVVYACADLYANYIYIWAIFFFFFFYVISALIISAFFFSHSNFFVVYCGFCNLTNIYIYLIFAILFYSHFFLIYFSSKSPRTCFFLSRISRCFIAWLTIYLCIGINNWQY